MIFIGTVVVLIAFAVILGLSTSSGQKKTRTKKHIIENKVTNNAGCSSKELKEEYDLLRRITDLKFEKEHLEKDTRIIWDEYHKAEKKFLDLQKKITEAKQHLKAITIPQTNQNTKAIVGIDFEYLLTGKQDTPCQVGLVKVVDNVVVLRYSTLINVPDDIDGTLSYGNGITREMVKDAPNFIDVLHTMESICEGAVLVAHNKSTEQSVIKKTCIRDGVDSWLASANMEDTCKLMGGRGLQECCDEYNIPLKHHDALSDAEACARLYLIIQGKKVVEEHVRIFGKRAKETCSSDVYKPISSDQVENKNTPFFGGVKTVVTGTFDNFPDRGKLKELLQSLGADVNTSISKRTQIVVAGKDCGPKKMEKVEEYGIRVITEQELMLYFK